MSKYLEDRVEALEITVHKLLLRLGEESTSTIPDWAKWKAMDEGGKWNIFSEKPKPNEEFWVFDPIRYTDDDDFEPCNPQPPKSDKHWTDTLEKI
tara:strand:- start:24 stop:308 length:285 start_codon:yes stop_codon:yes gene_type:complete